MNWLLHWLAVHTGTVNEAGPYYGFFSGFGSDISEIALIGAVIAGWRRVNCHIRGCPRIGRVAVEGTPFKVCWRHHPEGKPSHRHVIARHRAHEAAKGAS